MCTGHLPYKFLTPVFGFDMPRTCTVQYRPRSLHSRHKLECRTRGRSAYNPTYRPIPCLTIWQKSDGAKDRLVRKCCNAEVPLYDSATVNSPPKKLNYQ